MKKNHKLLNKNLKQFIQKNLNNKKLDGMQKKINMNIQLIN